MRILTYLTYITFILFAVFANNLYARDLSNLYSKSELMDSSNKYADDLQGLFREDFLSRLLLEERTGAQDVKMKTPLIGRNKSPWDFYALIDGQIIVIPILSVKFLDDLSISYAYMERHKCNMEMFYNYLTKIIYDEDYVPSPPRNALGIPSNALEDNFVDDVAQKLLKTAIFFLVGHEYAHIMYKHSGYNSISGSQAQSQEMQSDNFSLNVMRRIGAPPLGLAFFFSAASRLEPIPAAFKTRNDYDRYIKETSTHPLTGSRIRNIALTIRNNAKEFAKLQTKKNQVINELDAISNDIDKIGNLIQDGDFRQFQLKQGLMSTSAQLRDACK